MSPRYVHAPGPRIASALLLLLALGSATGRSRGAAPPKAKPDGGAIATVGDRRIEAIDIQRAAIALGDDPLRDRDPRAWRRMLLDRCVDRELLAGEAMRRGFDRDPGVARQVEEREYMIFSRELHERVLIPTLEPTQREIDSLQADRLYRYVDLQLIMLLDNYTNVRRPMAEQVFEAIEKGADFDSMAQLYNDYPPSIPTRGRVGLILARDLNPASHEAVRQAKPGDALGPYTDRFGHGIYKILGFEPLTDDSLESIVRFERRRDIDRSYRERLFRRYGFGLDTTQIAAALLAAAIEPRDTLLVTLEPDGTRPKIGSKPAIGVLAWAGTDSVTFRDVLHRPDVAIRASGKVKLSGTDDLVVLCVNALFPRLVIRDGRDRGLDEVPAIARELRLGRDGIVTRAMVSHGVAARPADDAALRAFFERNARRYRRPAGRIAVVVMFADEDSARGALAAWGGTGIPDSAALEAGGIRPRADAEPYTLWPRQWAAMWLPETGGDALSRSARALDEGGLTPVVAMPQGFAVAQIREKTEARALDFEEALPQVRRDLRDDVENRWVLAELERLRASTPIRASTARLGSVKLADKPSARGGK